VKGEVPCRRVLHPLDEPALVRKVTIRRKSRLGASTGPRHTSLSRSRFDFKMVRGMASLRRPAFPGPLPAPGFTAFLNRPPSIIILSHGRRIGCRLRLGNAVLITQVQGHVTPLRQYPFRNLCTETNRAALLASCRSPDSFGWPTNGHVLCPRGFPFMLSLSPLDKVPPLELAKFSRYFPDFRGSAS